MAFGATQAGGLTPPGQTSTSTPTPAGGKGLAQSPAQPTQLPGGKGALFGQIASQTSPYGINNRPNTPASTSPYGSSVYTAYPQPVPPQGGKGQTGQLPADVRPYVDGLTPQVQKPYYDPAALDMYKRQFVGNQVGAPIGAPPPPGMLPPAFDPMRFSGPGQPTPQVLPAAEPPVAQTATTLTQPAPQVQQPAPQVQQPAPVAQNRDQMRNQMRDQREQMRDQRRMEHERRRMEHEKERMMRQQQRPGIAGLTPANPRYTPGFK